jgi:Flp pilus assembly protein TadB
MVWIIAAVALGVIVYLFLPLWAVVTAVALLIGVPLLARRRKRQRARR